MTLIGFYVSYKRRFVGNMAIFKFYFYYVCILLFTYQLQNVVFASHDVGKVWCVSSRQLQLQVQFVYTMYVFTCKDCLPYLFHNFRNNYFNKISLGNMLYVQNKLYRFSENAWFSDKYATKKNLQSKCKLPVSS